MGIPPNLLALAHKAAALQSLDPALVCAVVEQESAWNTWAMRYEPAFFIKYVAPLYTNNKITATEAWARGFSWGLMQVMGQVARESGFESTFISKLCYPQTGLAIGSKFLRKKLEASRGDTTSALLAWNGGANPTYAAQVLARKQRYHLTSLFAVSVKVCRYVPVFDSSSRLGEQKPYPCDGSWVPHPFGFKKGAGLDSTSSTNKALGFVRGRLRLFDRHAIDVRMQPCSEESSPGTKRPKSARSLRCCATNLTQSKLRIEKSPPMSWKLILRLSELAVTLILATSLFLAWRAERNDRAKLAIELALAQQSLTQASDRQQSRDADLLHTLATLAAQRRDIQTPQQILQSLPQQIPLPQPITLAPPAAQPTTVDQTSTASEAESTTSSKRSPTAKPSAPEPQAIIPSADLKPLYDFALDCKACQSKLTAAQSDLADEKTKTVTLTKERDAAVRTAKGGSAIQRFARAAKWLLIGAAFGTLAARAAR